MIKTVEAVIDEQGNVRLLEPVRPRAARRALVTILEEGPSERVSESALLRESALAEDWNRLEEDQAWSHLQAGLYQLDDESSARATNAPASRLAVWSGGMPFELGRMAEYPQVPPVISGISVVTA
jgi:hypothetical protein